MARVLARLEENAPGDFFVDDRCIDCETCRIVAPSVFGRSDRRGMSIVARQPRSSPEALRAAMALVACPTSAIGTESKRDVAEAVRSYPDPIADGVSYCGFAAESSFGAASYFVERPSGNVLVDSPRAARPLMEALEARGGVSLMFLSHRDDVADHATYARRFGCPRVLGAGDAVAIDVERRLDGHEPVALATDLLAIPVPGHTRGSVALLYAGKFLFTGDHLWGSEDRARLEASRQVCWYSWKEQVRSLERLLAFDFEWVLPGHGARFHGSSAATRAALQDLLSRIRRGED
jgi:glyoxylase-like metal-dependent hydrolase (beta-lactamase superfamily II)/ferredoxin